MSEKQILTEHKPQLLMANNLIIKIFFESYMKTNLGA